MIWILSYQKSLSITNGKIFEIEQIDLIFRKDTMIYCDELPFGVLSPSHYFIIQTMDNISSYSGEHEKIRKNILRKHQILKNLRHLLPTQHATSYRRLI